MIAPEDGPAPALSRANSAVSGRFPPGSISRQGSLSRQGSNVSAVSGSNSEKQGTMGGLTIHLPSLFKRKPKEKDILAMYDSGNLRQLMEDLLISESERGAWLKLWLDIDTRFQNNVNYQAFIDYFLFEDNDFTRKIFEIINSDLSAVVTFREFIEFCKKYLVIDKDALQEFSFRLLLRQSARFSQSSVADAVDLKYFIVSRYGAADSKDTQKLSISLLKEMDGDEGLGLTCAQYKKFCKSCHSVEIFSTKFLQHMRNFIFGNDFWVKRSRMLKKVKLTGLAALTPIKRVNIDAEIYMNTIGLAVVDGKGRGIKMSAKADDATATGAILAAPSLDESVISSNTDPSRIRIRRGSSKESDGARAGGISRQASGVSTLSKQASDLSVGGMSRVPSGVSRVPSGVSRVASGDSDRAHSVLSRADSTRSVVSNLSMASAADVASSRRLWLVPFDHDSQMRTTFDEDFPAIFEKKQSRKMKKRKEKDERNQAADLMSARTYQIMVSALEDLVTSKKGLLAAFRIWKNAVGMNVELPEVTGEAKDDKGNVHDEMLQRSSSADRTTGNDEDTSIYTRILQSTKSINSESPEEAAKRYLKQTNAILHNQRFAYGNSDRMAAIKEHYFGYENVDLFV